MTDRRDRTGSKQRYRPAGGSRRSSGLRRLGMLLFTAALALLATGAASLSAGSAARADTPREYVGTLAFTVTAVSPVVVTAGSGNQLTVSGTVTNTSKQAVDDLQYVVQRGDALAGVTAVREELAHPGQPTTVVTQEWQDFGSSLLPGGSEPFRVTVGIGGDAVDSLAVTQRGVYPVMFNVNGDLADASSDGGSFHARVGELHTVLTVLSLPATPAGALHPTAGPTVTATAFTQIWPLVDRPHLGVAGVFLDDDLMSTVSAGGRLDAVLTALDRPDPGPDTVTVELDPELLDELERMSVGYRVQVPGQPQAALTPTTATTTPSSSASSTSSILTSINPTSMHASGTRTAGGAHPSTPPAAGRPPPRRPRRAPPRPPTRPPSRDAERRQPRPFSPGSARSSPRIGSCCCPTATRTCRPWPMWG